MNDDSAPGAPTPASPSAGPAAQVTAATPQRLSPAWLWANAGRIGGSFISLPTITAALYFLGAAYFSGYADGLRVPEDLFSYDFRDVLLASWESVTAGVVNAILFGVIVLAATSGVTLLWMVVSQLAAKGNPPVGTSQLESPKPASRPKQSNADDPADLIVGLSILGGVITVIFVALFWAAARSVNTGRKAGAARRVECLRARIVSTSDTANPLNVPGASRRERDQQVPRQTVVPPKADVARPLLYCARLGDRLIFYGDSGYIVRDRADVKAFWIRDSLQIIRDSVRAAHDSSGHRRDTSNTTSAQTRR